MEQMGLRKQGKQISRLIGYTNDGANSVPCRRDNGSRDSKFLDRSIFGIYIYGFCTGGSCLSQLLAFWENLLEAKEEGMDVDVMYIKYAKSVCPAGCRER